MQLTICNGLQDTNYARLRLLYKNIAGIPFQATLFITSTDYPE